LKTGITPEPRDDAGDEANQDDPNEAHRFRSLQAKDSVRRG
jgi:hypothetical protein